MSFLKIKHSLIQVEASTFIDVFGADNTFIDLQAADDSTVIVFSRNRISMSMSMSDQLNQYLHSDSIFALVKSRMEESGPLLVFTNF